jgi:RNA polymerase sigma-70 factor (ECF subfamily)
MFARFFLLARTVGKDPPDNPLIPPTMKPNEDELIPTRASLIKRLRDWEDQASWLEFFNTYWRLIHGVARKAGLTDAEAQDVVQETLISVAKHMPSFKYDPSIGSFKTWLLNMTRWRIIDQFRKRRPGADKRPASEDSSNRTSTIRGVADPNAFNWDAAWEADWEHNLLAKAMENIQRRVDPQRYQVFDFYVNKGWAAEKVANRFGVSIDQVYQIKHRVTETIRAEIHRIESEMT